jgi:hypothetical protein
MSVTIDFSDRGPFDDEERAVIRAVVDAVERADARWAEDLLAAIVTNIRQLDDIGELLCRYPSLFGEQSLGKKRRGTASLIASLSKSSPSNFEMFLPTRAIVSQTLQMGELNFYRLLRYVCDEALPEEGVRELKPRVEKQLCHCLYTRLAEIVLIDITSDETVANAIRDRSARALMQIWEQTTYRVSDFFPVLEATWDARRRFNATLGTLMGTSEMFRLIDGGCDEKFVDYLVRPERSEDEEAAFREFLFGASTEHLERIQEQMRQQGTNAIAAADAIDSSRIKDACNMGGDPALALFEFFLHRHLQAAARRQGDLPGPKRTAEEYVMLYFLEHGLDAHTPSFPPPPR